MSTCDMPIWDTLLHCHCLVFLWYESNDQFWTLHSSAKLDVLLESVCTHESITAKYVGRHVWVSYACQKYCITTGTGWVLTYHKLSAVQKFEADFRSHNLCWWYYRATQVHYCPSRGLIFCWHRAAKPTKIWRSKCDDKNWLVAACAALPWCDDLNCITRIIRCQRLCHWKVCTESEPARAMLW